MLGKVHRSKINGSEHFPPCGKITTDFQGKKCYSENEILDAKMARQFCHALLLSYVVSTVESLVMVWINPWSDPLEFSVVVNFLMGFHSVIFLPDEDIVSHFCVIFLYYSCYEDTHVAHSTINVVNHVKDCSYAIFV